MYQVRETIESKDHRQKIDSGQIIRSVVRRFVRLLAAAAVGRTACFILQKRPLENGVSTPRLSGHGPTLKPQRSVPG